MQNLKKGKFKLLCKNIFWWRAGSGPQIAICLPLPYKVKEEHVYKFMRAECVGHNKKLKQTERAEGNCKVGWWMLEIEWFTAGRLTHNHLDPVRRPPSWTSLPPEEQTKQHDDEQNRWRGPGGKMTTQNCKVLKLYVLLFSRWNVSILLTVSLNTRHVHPKNRYSAFICNTSGIFNDQSCTVSCHNRYTPPRATEAGMSGVD